MGNVIFYGKNMGTFFLKYRLISTLFGLVYFTKTSCISDYSKNILHWILPFHRTVCIVFPVIHWIKLLKTHPDWPQQSPKCLFPSLKQIWGFHDLNPLPPNLMYLNFEKTTLKDKIETLLILHCVLYTQENLLYNFWV